MSIRIEKHQRFIRVNFLAGSILITLENLHKCLTFFSVSLTKKNPVIGKEEMGNFWTVAGDRNARKGMIPCCLMKDG